MKKSFLDAVLSGKITEELNSQSPDMRKLIGILNETMNQLQCSLTDEQRMILDKYIAVQSEYEECCFH